MSLMCEVCKCTTDGVTGCDNGCECCNNPNYISPEDYRDQVVELIKARRIAYMHALDDARKDVPTSDDEYYESDEHYEAAIATLTDLLQEIEGAK
jgi:pyruvate-formate lyase-activating enzyme